MSTFRGGGGTCDKIYGENWRIRGEYAQGFIWTLWFRRYALKFLSEWTYDLLIFLKITRAGQGFPLYRHHTTNPDWMFSLSAWRMLLNPGKIDKNQSLIQIKRKNNCQRQSETLFSPSSVATRKPIRDSCIVERYANKTRNFKILLFFRFTNKYGYEFLSYAITITIRMTEN